MALAGVLGLDPSERFMLNDQRKDEIVKEELNQDHPTILSLPNVSLGLRNLRDSANPAKQIAMHFDKGTTTLSFIYKHGVVVCADSRATGGAYIGSQEVRKIIPINPLLLGTMAGGAADCTYWLRVLSEHCRLYELRNKKRISVAAASKLLSNIMYNYKGMGLSLGSQICGFDPVRGPQIYYVDNDGNRFPGKLFSVGSGSTIAYGVLDSFYKYDMTPEEAYDLGARAIFHAAHRDAYSGGIVRVYTITKDGWKIISERDHSELWDIYMKHRQEELK